MPVLNINDYLICTVKDKIITLFSEPWSGFIALVVLISVFAWIYLAVIADGNTMPDQATLPIIYADNKPYKSVPEEPGGMDIPYTSNSFLNPDQTGNAVIEQKAFKPMRIDIQADDKQTARIESLFESAPDATIVATEEPDEKEIVEIPKPVKPVISIKKKPAPPPPQTAVTKPTTPLPTGTHFVQLASLKSNADALAAWKSLSAKHTSLLGKQNKRVQKTDIAGKGTFYRLQAGPLNEQDAQNLCASLKKSKTSCFVVKK